MKKHIIIPAAVLALSSTVLALSGCESDTLSSDPTAPETITETATVTQTVEAEAETITETVTETVTEEAEAATVTVTAEPEEPEAPPAPEGAFASGDFVVEVVNCYADDWSDAAADIAVTNNGDSPADVFVTIEVIDGSGTRLAELITSVDMIGPGQTVNETAMGFDEVSGDFSCRVLSVEEW